MRWWLCGLLFAATALSFLDRQVLSVLAPIITAQLQMSDIQYSQVTNAFLVSYALLFLVGGLLMDALGTRRGMALSVGLWSVACALHAAAQNAFQLGLCRFLLGMGEGGCFPGAAKGVAQWFPERERALAMGLAIGGSSLGAVVAPPLTVWLAAVLGWRGVFLVTGSLGLIWVAAWWRLSDEASSAPIRNASMPTTETGEECGAAALHEPGWGRLVPKILRQPTSVGDEPSPLRSMVPIPGAAAPHEERLPLPALLRRLDVWGLALIRFIVDPVFYFYMFWIPKYLHQEREVPLARIGELAWIPFLALGLSNILGGWASDRIIRSGLPAWSARRWIMAAAALLTVSSSLAARMQTVEMAVAMMSLLMLAHGFWITNYATLISERFPSGAVGTVMGFAGAIGAVGGMLANSAIGWAVEHYSYRPIWLASGFLYPLAFMVLVLMVGGRLSASAVLASAPLSKGSQR